MLESEGEIEETTDLLLERHDALLAAGRSRAAAHGTEGQDCEEDGDEREEDAEDESPEEHVHRESALAKRLHHDGGAPA